MSAPSMVKPALIGGAIAGVAAGLPGLNLVNTCTCCSFVVAGGFLAAYLQSSACKAAGVKFDAGAGALSGLLAGLFYGVVVAVVGILVSSVIGDPLLRRFLEWVQQLPDTPPEALDMIDEVLLQLEEKTFGVIDFIKRLLISLASGAVFSTLGGLIGGAVFKFAPAETAAPAPPPAPEA